MARIACEIVIPSYNYIYDMSFSTLDMLLKKKNIFIVVVMDSRSEVLWKIKNYSIDVQ